ncbi:MAG: 2Fe-2S iron-sulfur cluster-binding protein [Bacteroidota bacterium]
MATIKVIDTDGQEEAIEFKAKANSNLMELLVSKGKDIPAICGGMANCGTCHVEFKQGFEKLDTVEEDEAFMLDTLPNITDTSRLSCQVSLTDALDGAELVILNDG